LVDEKYERASNCDIFIELKHRCWRQFKAAGSKAVASVPQSAHIISNMHSQKRANPFFERQQAILDPKKRKKRFLCSFVLKNP